MRRYLVVGNQTLGGEQLLISVRERLQAGPCHFHVVVPATPASRLDQEYVSSVPEHVRIRRTYKLPVTQITGPAHAGPMWTTKE